jgi:release factor glutamine methyltransferase
LRIQDIFSGHNGLASLDLIIIAAYALGCSKEHLLANGRHEVEEREAQRIEELIADRIAGKPVSYIVQSKEFFSETLFVDERVLIPRPETELLVEEGLNLLEKRTGAARIMDMGTGSGAVGLIISKKTGRPVLCVDISPEALDVARRNARLLGVSDKTPCLCSDLFEGIREGERFDLILANLPYIGAEEWRSLTVDVRAFEPRSALVGGNHGTEVYKRFISAAAHRLAPYGHLLCEVAGDSQAKELGLMLLDSGLHVASRRDYSGRERVITGSWTSLS